MGAADTESLADPCPEHCSTSEDLAAPAGPTGRKVVPPLLRHAEFRRYWSASTVSMVGDQVTAVAVPLTAVLALHAGAAVMGFLTALWVAVIGGVAGAALLVPSPLPRFRLPG